MSACRHVQRVITLTASAHRRAIEPSKPLVTLSSRQAAQFPPFPVKLSSHPTSSSPSEQPLHLICDDRTHPQVLSCAELPTPHICRVQNSPPPSCVVSRTTIRGFCQSRRAIAIALTLSFFLRPALSSNAPDLSSSFPPSPSSATLPLRIVELQLRPCQCPLPPMPFAAARRHQCSLLPLPVAAAASSLLLPPLTHLWLIVACRSTS